MCAGKDTSGALTEAIKLFNKPSTRPDGVKVKKLELAADATEVRNQFIQRAQAKSRRLRRAAVRHHLDRGVRPAGLDHGPQRLRERRARTSSSRPRCPPTTTTASSGACRRSPARACSTAARDQVADAPATWQELYEEGAANDGFAYQGAPVRGPDLQLRRAVLRRRRHDPLRGRQEGRVRLAREPEGAAADGRRHEVRRRGQGEPHLHGGAGPDGVRVRQGDLHAQLELRLRAGQEGHEGQGRRRGLPAAAVRGRRQGRRAGRQRAGRERLHRQPRGLGRCGSTTGPRRRRSSATRRSTRCRRRCRSSTTTRPS